MDTNLTQIMTKSPEQKISDDKYLRHQEFQRTSKLYTLERIPRGKELFILDVGCGTGVNSIYMVELGHKVVGTDISEVAIQKYNNRGLNGIQCDLNKGMPFNNASFDLIFASEVLEHLHDITFFLSESYRVLKPGGILLLSTPNSAFWVYRVLGIVGKTISELQHPGHIHFFSKKSLLSYSRKCGFVRPKIYGRHMYILIGSMIGQFLNPILVKIGFVKEHRFRTSTNFWHKSRYASRASGFWADTFILETRKPKDCSQ